MRTSVLFRAIHGSCLALFFTFSGVNLPGIGFALAQDDYTEDDSGRPVENGSTISYGPDFFAQHPNAITALDIIRRIPAGNTILNSGDSGNRGFSSNDDRILINGKRLSGKSNDSQSALGRITIDKIARINVIRGSSPDVKVSSQESILNIILKDGAGNGGSGSWRFDAEVKHGPQVAFGGFLSYGGSFGSFDYFVSLESDPQNRQTIQNELFFDGMDAFTNQLDEVIDRKARSNKFAGNFGYTFKGGQILRLNALYEDLDFTDINSGILSDPDGMGGVVFAGNSTRFEFRPRSTIEIGGDFEADLSDVLKLKIIALYSVKDQGVTQREDFLIEGDMPVDDFVFIDDSEATENIGRASLTWQAAPAHSLEFGIETAINELDVNLVFLENDGSGNLIPVDIPGSQVLIKEVRNEPFIIHSWKMNGKINIDTSLVIESFTISQNGVDVNVENSFFFLRPSIDFRYNITDRDQFQISIRRRINQLDFRDFAASASDDDDVIGANADLTPEKVWAFETSYEHRLANDGGRIKLSILFERRSDRIERIEVAEGVSGVGNVGTGYRFDITLRGSFRLAFIGLPDVIIEPKVAYYPSWITDPFIGQRRRFNNWNDHNVVIGFRHDVSALGLSYGGEFAYYGPYTFHDIDETIASPGKTRVDIFIEKKLFGTTKLRFDATALTNTDRGRFRTLFDAGIAGGIITASELRDRREGRRFQISLQGTY